MKKQVLDVGNCGPDHSSIKSMLERFCDANVLQANEAKDALKALESKQIDLVLVNRKLDIDYSDGIDVIKAIKADPRYAAIPVMLVSIWKSISNKPYKSELVMALVNCHWAIRKHTNASAQH